MAIKSSQSEAKTQTPESLDERAQFEANKILKKHMMEAFWAREDRDINSLLLHIAHDISQLFGRNLDDISVDDTIRAYQRAENLLLSANLRKIRLGFLLRSIEVYKKATPIVQIVGHAYRLGSLLAGNFDPLLRKLAMNTSGLPLGRVAGVWFAGQIIIALYWDPQGLPKTKAEGPRSGELPSFDPLFDGLDIERLREISVYLDLDARIKWDVDKLKLEILSSLKESKLGPIASMWSEVPSYRDTLLSLCHDLKVPNVLPSDAIAQLECRIVQKVFAESVGKLSPDDLKKFEHAALNAMQDEYWGNVAHSGIKLGALSLANLSGFNLYLAASSGLAALSNGLGFTLAFTTYTTMSTALATIVGPLGLTVAGGLLAYDFAKPRPRKALPFVLYMAILRAHIQKEEGQRERWWSRFFTILRIFFPKLRFGAKQDR